MKLFLADSTAQAIAAYANQLPHALLLVGPAGVGLRSIAIDMAGDALSGIIEPTDAKGNVDHSSSGVVRIVQIRELTGGAINKSRKTRIYIIDDADKMNAQAQNAFLKLLEEPAPHVHFILLSHNNSHILPTILSRVQMVRVAPISNEQSRELLDTLKIREDTVRAQLLFLAEGLPAELYRLVDDKDLFAARVTSITAARQFLQGTLREKFIVINSLSSDRIKTLEMLAYAQRIIAHSMRQKPSRELVKRAEQLSDTYDQIASNGYIRIQLLSLVV